MGPSRPFILRPVATSLLMVAVIIGGAVAYRQLPVSALPEVDYPTIQVTTFYPGASPDVMATSVTAPCFDEGRSRVIAPPAAAWPIGTSGAAVPMVVSALGSSGPPACSCRLRRIR